MTNQAIRWSGLAVSVGAVLLGAAIVRLSFGPSNADLLSSPLISTLFFVSCLLLLLGLPGMYARQASTAGWLGLLGHVLFQTGILLPLILGAVPLVYPSSKISTPGDSVTGGLLGIAWTLGLLLTAIATTRAAVFPRATGILLLAATAGFFFNFFIAELLPSVAGQVGGIVLGILIALPLTWIGVWMWRDRAA
jgi:hypothetical protein